MKPSSSYPDPIIILGAPRSFTSLICAMLGENPMAFGVPELNLFVADTLEEISTRMVNMRQIQLHGLLRTIAHLHAGEQTMTSIEMAQRWILRHLDWSTASVYEYICQKVGPLRVVDKSPIYVADQANLERIRSAFPGAHYIHLVRHPLTQGKSIMAVADGAMAVLNRSIDLSTDPPTVDPQILWHRAQRTIRSFLETIPGERWLMVRGEDLLTKPEEGLAEICRAVGLQHDSPAISAMMHPERSPFAGLGPMGAHLGNDINFLNSPSFKPSKPRPADLEGALPWRPDGANFRKEVVDLARELGYS